MTTERTLEQSNNTEVTLVGDFQTELAFPGGDVEEANKDEQITLEYAKLPIRDISIIPGHARRNVGSVDDLISSFSTGRECSPISVVISPENEALIFEGGRRFEAYKQLKREHIPCNVFTGLSLEEALRRSFTENLHRRSLSPIDIAEAIKREQQKGLSFRDMEIKLGYGSYANLANHVKLLELPKMIQAHIHTGKIKPGLAHTLFKLPGSAEQEDMAKRIIDEGLSIKQAEALIEKANGNASKPYLEPKANIPTEYPGITIRRQHETPEEPSKSMALGISFLPMRHIKTVTKGAFADSIGPCLEIIKDAIKKLRDGAAFGFVFPDKYSDRLSNTNRLVGSLIHPVLTNHGYTFSGRILNVINDEESYTRHLQKNLDSNHTDYQIYDVNLLDLHVYIKKGEKQSASDASNQKSRLSDEELTKLMRSTWTYDLQKPGGIEEVRIEIAKNFIKLFSHIGESVFDPFGTDLSVLKAALELERIPTCYINDSYVSMDDLDAVFTPPVEDKAQGITKPDDKNSALHSAKKFAAISAQKSPLITRQLPPFIDSASV